MVLVGRRRVPEAATLLVQVLLGVCVRCCSITGVRQSAAKQPAWEQRVGLCTERPAGAASGPIDR